MAEQEKWEWQKSGTAWRGIGVYHITLTIPSREPFADTQSMALRRGETSHQSFGMRSSQRHG